MENINKKNGFEFNREYDFVSYSEKYYKTTVKEVLDSEIPFNSEFDDSAENSDFRIVKTKCFEWDFENDKPIIDDIVYDIQCYCQHLGDSKPKWESIIKYPRFASGAKQRTAYHRIQDKIKKLRIK